VDIYPWLITGQYELIVDWGDAQVDTFTPQNIPNLPATINHTYATPGNYAICFTHSNASLGCSNTYCDTVAVSGSSNPSIICNAEFIVDTVNSLQGNVVLWNTSYAIDASGQLVSNISYSWDFGDGTTSNLQFPTHNYANPGIYPVCVTITAIVPPTALSPGDTCVSTFCDTLGVDANGNLIYKGVATGWTLRVLDPNSIGIEEKALGNIKTYPNPVNDVLKIDLPLDLEAEVELSIFSMSGALLKQETAEVGTNSYEIDVANLPSGLYMMQMRISGITKQVKIVKQ
jgi:PKD repeat protein